MMSSEELNSYLELWKKSDKIKESNFNKKLFNYALVINKLVQITLKTLRSTLMKKLSKTSITQSKINESH